MAEHSNYQNKLLTKVIQSLFNRRKHSDVVFIVNNTQYYASKIIITGYSREFEVMLNEHLQDSDTKSQVEITIHDVKHNESFVSILEYMYGLEIKFDELKQSIICEILNLAKMYKLSKFYKDVKCYLSKIKVFESDSVLTLLNTAKRHGINDLYERLQAYVFHNTEEILMHETLPKVHYNVLLDLIKSSWLYTAEENILKCVLNWHNVNLVHGNFSDTKTESETISSRNCEFVNLAESFTNDESVIELNEIETIKTTFSENILCSLLKHIRFSRISLITFVKEFKEQYKEFLAKHECILLEQYDKLNYVPRLPYVPSDIETKQFTVKLDDLKKGITCIGRSKENHVTNDMSFNLFVKTMLNHDLGVFMACQPNKVMNSWECKVTRLFRLISHSPFCRDLQNDVSTVTFSSKDPKMYGTSNFINFTELLNPDNGFVHNEFIKFEVDFIKVELKTH